MKDKPIKMIFTSLVLVQILGKADTKKGPNVQGLFFFLPLPREMPVLEKWGEIQRKMGKSSDHDERLT